MMDSALATIRDDLQTALDRGWREFHESEMPALLKAFTIEILGGERYFHTRFRTIVPHPGHERMARLVGRYVPKVLIQHAIQLDQHWPGEFGASSEAQDGDLEIRTFYLTVHRGSQVLGRLSVSYPHKHSDFDVPHPPTVAIA